MMIGISNDATNQLIATSSKNAGKILKEWPGMKFPTSTPEGKALLGRSPCEYQSTTTYILPALFKHTY
jgi:hypothetical protein